MMVPKGSCRMRTLMIVSSLAACRDDTCFVYEIGGGEGGGSPFISSSLDVPIYETVSGEDVLFDWSSLDRDHWCLPMDPSTIVEVQLLAFPELTEDALVDTVVGNDLRQSDVSSSALCYVSGETSCWLSEMTSHDAAIDPAAYSEDGGSYAMFFMDNTEAGALRSFALLRPRGTSGVTEARFEPTCPMVTLAVDLSAGGAGSSGAACTAGSGPSWVVDWTGAAFTAGGGPFVASNVDSLELSRYDLDVPELEASFVLRDSLATHRYSLDPGDQTSADLSDAKDERGARFSGFEPAGLWVVELRESRAVCGARLRLRRGDARRRRDPRGGRRAGAAAHWQGVRRPRPDAQVVEGDGRRRAAQVAVSHVARPRGPRRRGRHGVERHPRRRSPHAPAEQTRAPVDARVGAPAVSQRALPVR